MRRILVSLPPFLAALLALCLWAAPAPAAPLVLAAASMQESLTAAADAWARAGHARPILSFAASSALARQIEAGAPADLFVSADEAWMDALAARRLIRPASRATLVGNRLVLVAPAADRRPLAVRPGFPLARALGGGRLAIADPDAVPAGRYGKAALTALGVWPSVAGRLAPGDSVRAALALVERGETPYGIVYATDARAAPGVCVVGVFPATSHPPIRYPIAILAGSADPDTAPFRAWLLSPAGRAVFARFGFVVR